MNRLITKADRERSRETQFNYMTKNGYQKTEHKNLIIFYHPTELLLKTFWGTAANHTDFYKYRTAEQLAAKIESLKQTADSREKWKAEQKEKNKGYKSSHAAASAAIKAELNKEFAGVKFSVKSDSFAGGDSVHISWTDGPTTEQVEKFSGKYQYGHFNGMEDIYENTNSRDDIPQVKYVSESRSLSDEIIKEVATKLQEVKAYTEQQIYSYNESPETEAKQLLYQTSIPLNYISLSVVRCDNPSNRHPFKIVFETEKQPEPPKKQPTTEKSGKVQIVDYSEKAFAVIGEFSPYYDDLLSLGGRYNKFLKCGRGIIFSKTKMEAVKEYLIKAKATDQQPEPEQTPEQKPTKEPETTINELPEQIVIAPPVKPLLPIDFFTILWHEGRQIEGATYDKTTFKTWDEVQQAFFILWYVNERRQDGGYTKVKCIYKEPEKTETEPFRVDITNRSFNGDFNPSLQHISDYFQEETDTEEISEETEQMRQYMLY